jgi:hypothetical protein
MHNSTTPCRRLLQSIDITNIAVTRPFRPNAAIEPNDIELRVGQCPGQCRSDKPFGARDKNTNGYISSPADKTGSLSIDNQIA